MKSKIIVQLFLIVTIFYFEACHAKVVEDKIKSFNDIYSDSFVRDIPFNKLDTSFSKLKKSVEDVAGFYSIENGVKEFEIRIWSDLTQDYNEKLIIITKQGSTWFSKVFKIIYHYDKSKDILIPAIKQSYIAEPKSGWASLPDSLIELGILNLPDYSKIDGYNLRTDETGITVEIASDKKYRIYSYPGPEYNSKKFEQAKSMYKIINLLDKEFNW